MLTTTLLGVAIIVTLLAFVGRHLDIRPLIMRVIMLAGLGAAIGCLIIIGGGWAWAGVIVAALLCLAIVWASENDTAAPTPGVAKHETPHAPRSLPRHATVKGITTKPSAPTRHFRRQQRSKQN